MLVIYVTSRRFKQSIVDGGRRTKDFVMLQ